MLPKPKKIKKTKIEQQDIFEKIKQEKNIRNKRNYLLISIFLTIGLSFIFYSFNKLKFWLIDFPYYSSPKISTSNPINSINNIIRKDQNDWLIVVKTPQDIFFNKDKKSEINPDSYFNSLDQVKVLSSSLVSSILPQGINYRESIKNIESKYIYNTEIILPKDSFYIHIEISGLSSVEGSISKIPEILENLYWATVSLI
jgi:hypothetical protein